MTVYVKVKKLGNVKSAKVLVSDTGDVYCHDEAIQKSVKKITLYEFPVDSKHQTYRKVITIMDITQKISYRYPECDVVSVGEKEILVEYDRSKAVPKWKETIKVAAVCILVFFGAAFTIMAFNNDISIQGVFDLFYMQMTGEKKPDVSEIEIAYSLGMTAGIIVFFNHIGKKRITNDMTPIEIEFDKHKKDICDAMVDSAQEQEE